MAVTELNSLISTTAITVEPFVLGTQTLDFNLLPPFITFLVYKASAILTDRLWLEMDVSDGLRKLRILRGFLKLVSTRWLAGGELSESFRGTLAEYLQNATSSF